MYKLADGGVSDDGAFNEEAFSGGACDYVRSGRCCSIVWRSMRWWSDCEWVVVDGIWFDEAIAAGVIGESTVIAVPGCRMMVRWWSCCWRAFAAVAFAAGALLDWVCYDERWMMLWSTWRWSDGGWAFSGGAFGAAAIADELYVAEFVLKEVEKLCYVMWDLEFVFLCKLWYEKWLKAVVSVWQDV